MKETPEESVRRLSQTIVDKTAENVVLQDELVKRTNDAKLAMAEAVKGIRVDMIDWFRESREYLEKIRQWRMAVEMEVKQARESVGDAKETLLSDESKAALGQLGEFVSICERVEKLKSSGTFEVMLQVFLSIYEHRESTVPKT